MSYPTWSDLNKTSIVPILGARQAPRIGPVALLVSTEPDLRYLKSRAGKLSTSPFFMGSLMVQDNSGGKGISIAGPYMGAPYGTMLLESLIARGARHIIVLGWCGSLTGDIGIGDMIIPSRAIVDEGTSRHYAALEGEQPFTLPHKELSEQLIKHSKKNLLQRDINLVSHPVWTTDAIYRETCGKVAWYREKGAFGVEMECSALFAVARYRDVEITSLLVVSDSLADGAGWEPGFRNKRFKAARIAACDLVMDFASKFSG